MKYLISETKKMIETAMANVSCKPPALRKFQEENGVYTFRANGPSVRMSVLSRIANNVIWEVHCNIEGTRSPRDLVFDIAMDDDVLSNLIDNIREDLHKNNAQR